MGANTKFDSLSDYARHHANIQLTCWCDHIGVLHTGRVQRWFRVHRWNDYIEASGSRFRCSICHGRARRIRPIHHMAAPLTFPAWMEHEHQWKDLVERLRG